MPLIFQTLVAELELKLKMVQIQFSACLNHHIVSPNSKVPAAWSWPQEAMGKVTGTLSFCPLPWLVIAR